ncbi:MAG: hypothetical protein IJB22_01355 [Clostridia bacterium]|nr:hypothetical protein [Clostridia bacterium]MBQ7112766.1 hypothetical protein [Clostridia bacterium]
MAVAARKDEYLYAPSRVYSHSRQATAEALPQQPYTASPEEQPTTKPVRQAGQPAVRTRVNKGLSPRRRRKQRIAPMVLSVVGVFAIAAMLIGVITRYASIALAYSAVNDLEDSIEESERNIAALNVQLNNALDINAARAAALEAGLWYPAADQIVTVRQTVGSYTKADDGGTADAQLNGTVPLGDAVAD